MLTIQQVRLLDLVEVERYSKTRRLGHPDHAPGDHERLARESLTVLPDPVRVDRCNLTGRRGGRVSKHRERDVEMIVRVRTPRKAEVAAHLRDADRALHRPE